MLNIGCLILTFVFGCRIRDHGHPSQRDLGECAWVVDIVVVEPKAHKCGFREATHPAHLGVGEKDVLGGGAIKHAEVSAIAVEHPCEDDEPPLGI